MSFLDRFKTSSNVKEELKKRLQIEIANYESRFRTITTKEAVSVLLELTLEYNEKGIKKDLS